MPAYDPNTHIVLATRNKGKLAELGDMLKDFGLTVLGLDAFPEIGEIEETGQTFAENALLKARAVSQAAGLAALADDSGLCVDALDGAPGVYSARYSGPNATDEQNNAKLLNALKDVPQDKRTARFVCAMAAAAPDGRILETSGAWEGRIATAPRGENGFGYDPLFFDDTAGITSAQMTKDQKNARSHRGAALERLLEEWEDFWGKRL